MSYEEVIEKVRKVPLTELERVEKFCDFIIWEKGERPTGEKLREIRRKSMGCWEGKISIAEDFNAPMELL